MSVLFFKIQYWTHFLHCFLKTKLVKRLNVYGDHSVNVSTVKWWVIFYITVATTMCITFMFTRTLSMLRLSFYRKGIDMWKNNDFVTENVFLFSGFIVWSVFHLVKSFCLKDTFTILSFFGFVCWMLRNLLF